MRIQLSRASLLTSSLLLAFGFAAQAQTGSSKPPTSTLHQAATARYEADQKLCAQEASAEARLQCRRDARAVYDKALAALQPGQTPGQAAVCATCGKVTAVRVTEKAGESNAAGLIAGGVAGAVLGHQVGGGLGKDLATIAGAAGGAYAGKKIQENMNTRKIWTVAVRYNDGSTAEFTYEKNPGFAVGDPVRKSGKVLVRN